MPRTAQPNAVGAARGAAGSVLVFLVFIEITSGFVQGFYTPLLPAIAAQVGVSGEAMNWFQTAQAMAAAVMVPLMARMGDVYGPRRVLRAAIGVVLVGTVLVAVAPTYAIVLLGRVLIGPLGVWLPLAIAIIYVRASQGSTTRSISIISASLMGGIVVGTLAAGAAEALLPNLPTILMVPVLMVALSTVVVFFFLPADVDLSAGKIDWVGFVGLGLLLVTLILALAFMGPSHARLSLILFAATAVLFAIWLWWEQRSPDPAVDLKLVVSKAMGPLYASAFAMGIIMIDAPPNLADYLSRDPEKFGYGFGAGPSLLATMIAIMLIFAAAGAFLSSFIAAKAGMRRTLVSAALLGAVGQLVVLVLPHYVLAFWISGILTGFGLGVLVGTLPALVSHAAPLGRTGIANGIYSALLAMGGAVGGAVFKQVLAAFRGPDRITALSGYMTIWGISVFLFLLTAVMLASVALPGHTRGKVH